MYDLCVIICTETNLLRKILRDIILLNSLISETNSIENFTTPGQLHMAYTLVGYKFFYFPRTTLRRARNMLYFRRNSPEDEKNILRKLK